jgi:hypothetical protein
MFYPIAAPDACAATRRAWNENPAADGIVPAAPAKRDRSQVGAARPQTSTQVPSNEKDGIVSGPHPRVSLRAKYGLPPNLNRAQHVRIDRFGKNFPQAKFVQRISRIRDKVSRF